MEEGDDGTMVKAATFFATSLLPQWSGYLIIIGFSLLFALMAWFLTWVEEKFSRVRTTAEHVSRSLCQENSLLTGIGNQVLELFAT